MGRLGRVGVVGVYGEEGPEEIERRPSWTTPPQEGRPLRVSGSSVTRVPPNKLKRLSEGWVMVNVESSYRRPPIPEEPVPVPTRRQNSGSKARAPRMLRGRSHSDPQIRPEQGEQGQHSRPRPSQSQKNLSSRDNPSKSGRDRDRSGHRDRDKDKDRIGNGSTHHRSTPRRPSGSGSSPPQSLPRGTTSHAAKAIAMIDAAGSKDKAHRDNDDHHYSTYPNIKQDPVSPRRGTLKKLLNRGESVEKSEKKSSKKTKKHTSFR